ncbi:MAG: putative repeat protein, partial [Verrucomicrobiales bacterium]|nr:putative repeat protein [Verrucomicrobiales bacterium]
MAWNREQSSHLSTTNVTDFSADDYKRARWRRWLGHNNTLDTPFDVNTLSTEQAASSDGVTDGQITWYDYEGKTYSDGQGTQILPGVIARVQPDGTTWYKYFQRNLWGNVTNEIERWTNGVGYSRTNRYVYSTDGTDLLYHRGPSDDASHARVGYFYDSYHQPLRMTNAVNEVTTYTYDGSHRLSTEMRPTGLLKTYTYYPSLNFLSNVVDTVSGTPTRTNLYTWQNGMVRTLTDERGLVATYSFDLLNRPTTTIYPDGTGETNVYTRANGTKIIDRAFFYDRLGDKTSFVWDGLQRLIYQTNALGVVTQYGYCDCGGLSSVVQGLGTAVQSTTSYYYDEAGHRTRSMLGDNTSITNVFDSLGQIVITRDGLGSTTNYFDNVGRLAAVWNTGGQVEERLYDLDDRVIDRTDADGREFVNTYDSAGRLVTRLWPNAGVEKLGYSANVAGPSSYTNQLSKVWQYTYDPYGRKTKEVAVSVYTNSFSYSPAGDLLTLQDGKSQVTSWKYDRYGQVTNKTDAASLEILRYLYDAAGQLTNRWSKAKLNTTYKYDVVGNLTNVVYNSSPQITNRYDALNRLTNMVDAAGTSSFTYNGAGKLLTEDSPWASDTLTYSYNTAGLRASLSIQQPSGSFTNGYRYDANSRLTNLTSTAGTFSYNYTSGAGASRLVRRLSLP